MTVADSYSATTKKDILGLPIKSVPLGGDSLEIQEAGGGVGSSKRVSVMDLGAVIQTITASEFADSVFRITNNADPTKKLAFQVSSIATATVRTITVPDGDVTFSIGTLISNNAFDANTVLVANSDNTPLALTVGASRLLGRKASGNIAAMTAAEAKTVLALTGADSVLARISGSTFSTLQHLQNIFHSSGWFSGAGITDNGDGTIDVAAGTGSIRATDDPLAEILFFDWAAPATGLPVLTDNQWNWVFVDFNAGSPVVTASTTEPTQSNTVVLLAEIYRLGTVLNVTPSVKHLIGDHASQMIQRLKETMPFAHVSGGVLSEPASLKVAISTGAFWNGLTKFTTAAFDSNVSDDFSRWHRDGGGGWTEVTAQTDVNATQFDDGDGTLGTVNNGRFGTHYVYCTERNTVHFVYGRGQAFTLTDAQADTAPGDLPPILSEPTSAVLVAKIIIQKGASTYTVESAFVKPIGFGGSGLQSVKDDLSPELGANLVTGSFTVDGRDVGADGTKLDAIESSATADQTGAEIATALVGETLVDVTTKDIAGTLVAHATPGTTEELDYAAGDYHLVTLDANLTYTLVNFQTVSVMVIQFIQDSTARTLTHPAALDWGAAGVPVMPIGSGDRLIIVLSTKSGGTVVDAVKFTSD